MTARSVALGEHIAEREAAYACGLFDYSQHFVPSGGILRVRREVSQQHDGICNSKAEGKSDRKDDNSGSYGKAAETASISPVVSSRISVLLVAIILLPFSAEAERSS